MSRIGKCLAVFGLLAIFGLTGCGGGDDSASDTTAPSLTSSATLPAVSVGQASSDTIAFDESISSVSVGVLPNGMKATASVSGSTVNLVVSTSIYFTAFGNVAIPLIVADNAAGKNARTVLLNKTITEATPTGPLLSDVGPLLDRGGNLIKFDLNALSGLPSGAAVVGVDGFPKFDEFSTPTNLTCDAAGSCSVVYDIANVIGSRKTFQVTVEVMIPGYSITLKRPQNIIIENEA